MEKIYTIVNKSSFISKAGNFPENKLYLPENVMEWAARTCYHSVFSYGKKPDFLASIVESEHFDVIEHGFFGFKADWQFEINDMYYMAYHLNKIHPYLKVDLFPAEKKVGLYGNMRVWYDVQTKNYVNIWGGFSAVDMQDIFLTLHNLAPNVFELPNWLRSQNETIGKLFRKEYASIRENALPTTGTITKTGANVLMIGGATDPHTYRNHYTFQVSNVSRSAMAQWTRHRKKSFSVASQRYIDAGDFTYVLPSKIDGENKLIVEELMRDINAKYKKLRQTSLKEDARCILPNAATTQIIVSAEQDGWDHFFKLRCAKDAQEEIRLVANAIRDMMRGANESSS